MKPLEEATTGFETVYQISAFIYSTQKSQYRPQNAEWLTILPV